MLMRLWRHISPRRRVQLAILFILMVVAAFAEVLSIGAVLPFLSVLTAPDQMFSSHLAQPVIHQFGLQEPDQLLLLLTIVFAAGALISGALRLILLWAQTRLSYAIGADFSMSIYRRTLYQPYSVHVSRNSSVVIAGISNKANGVVGTTILPLLTIVNSTLMLTSILAAVLAIEPAIAISSVAGFGFIYVVVILITRKALTRDSQSISQDLNQVVKALQEGLGGIRDVLIDGTQATYCDIYRKADMPLRRAQARIAIIGASPRYAIEALGMVLIAALAYFLVNRPSGMTAAIPVLGALALGAQRLLPVLQQAYSSWTLMRGGHASLRDTLDLLDQPLPAHATAAAPEPMPFQSAIELCDLSFRYAAQAPWVLQNLNLKIPKGARVGFIGTTGSGKSTLLDIIMGLLSPTTGSIAIDGVVVTSENHRAWQAHIAHVPQAIFLADATIAENIAFGIPAEQIDIGRVRQAAERAQISVTIESWSDQYNTMVGERGVRLSGGQRQRIGIARALYKRADVIVFDEATSALDNETERAVIQAIEALGEEVTMIIVAHRLTTLRNCTQIVVLSQGGIARVGNYQELVRHAV
jgi:ATP-binding cassette subfamily B protein